MSMWERMALKSAHGLCQTWEGRHLPWWSLPGQTPSLLPQRVTHRASLFSQDMGVGLAVVPLMGLLESIAVAKSFGKMPATHTLLRVPAWSPTCLTCLLACLLFVCLDF